MNNYENRFFLKPITKSTDEDYIKALQIYVEETPKEIRTNTNEISHWLDKKRTSKSFEIMVFVLFLDDILIGFSQLTYIKSQQIVIWDYISLKTQYRKNSVFLIFLSMMQNYLVSANKEITYYLAEIGNKDNGEHIDRESTFYKRIICLEGYGQVMSKYYNFPLGLDNCESEFESLMYLKTNDNISYISKETFMNIVHAICYDYYYVWYSEFINNDEVHLYKAKLDKYYSSIEKYNCEATHININYIQCPLFFSGTTNKTSGTVPSKKRKRYAQVPFLLLAIIITPIILAVMYNAIFPLLNIDFNNISTFISGIIATLVSYFAIKLGSKK